MNQHNEQTKWSQFLSLVIVFFFWGFVAESNDILIPVFKKWFVLSQLQSQLVAWAFYAAYFVGSVIFFIISLKSDILQKFGYKKTLAVGLSISAIGAFLFFPAASSANFWFFLMALFVVGLGFSVQQIVANPLAIKMGSASTGAHRLTLAGGINSLGTTIGPIIVGIALFGTGNKSEPLPANLSKTETLVYEYKTLKTELETNILDLGKDSQVDSAEKTATETKVNNQISKLNTGLATLEVNKNLSDELVNQYSKQLDETKKEAAKAAEDMLRKMHLPNTENIMKSYPFELSGGMRQRVGVAMAMFFKPRLLLADEPTSALDVTTQAQVVKEMMEICQQDQTAIIIVTHNIGVAAYMSDKLIVMQNGEIVESGRTDEIIARPQSAYTRELLDAVPQVGGKRYVS